MESPSSPTCLPASYIQEQWFRSTENGLSRVNLVLALEFRGPLNRSILQAALDDLVARHETLRTTMTVTRSGVHQLIWPTGHLPLHEIDLTPLGNPSRSDAEQVALAEVDRPFDLRRSVPARATLVRLHPLKHLLVVVVHHAIADGWATSVLTRDLLRLYSARVLGRPSPLAPLEVQFGDYAAWERSVRHSVSEAYWQKQLARADHATPRLPIRRTSEDGPVWLTPRPLRPSSPDLVDALSTTARRQGTSLAAALVAASASALASLASPDVTLAFSYANRDRPEVQPIVGCLADFLPLRVGWPRNATFEELLRHVRDSLREAHRHRIPFGRIQAGFGRTGTWSENLLFDAHVNFRPHIREPAQRLAATSPSSLEVSRFIVPLERRSTVMDRYPLAPYCLDYNLHIDEEGRLQGSILTIEGTVPDETLDQLAEGFNSALLQGALNSASPVRL